ncbi:hypothetical protein BASA81_016474 [Batrachochytrium salamandrivorans]|nr:hypothetical protein BASA81_016474 [Batrachochytrium salamandrivorans]
MKHGLQAGLAFFKNDKETAMREAFQAVSLVTQKAQGGQPSADADAARKKTIEQKSSEADVVMFSGCKDSQTSADAVIDGSATGAMSWALLAVLSQNPNPNLTDLLRQLREKLHGKYEQIPQMSTSRQVDVVKSSFHLG